MSGYGLIQAFDAWDQVSVAFGTARVSGGDDVSTLLRRLLFVIGKECLEGQVPQLQTKSITGSFE